MRFLASSMQLLASPLHHELLIGNGCPPPSYMTSHIFTPEEEEKAALHLSGYITFKEFRKGSGDCLQETSQLKTEIHRLFQCPSFSSLC